MKKFLSLLLSGLFLLMLFPVWGQVSITTLGVASTQNFNGMGNSATAPLPSGFKFGADWSTGTTATTHAAGTTGTGVLASSSAGGAYNFANGATASSTERSIGFLSSGVFTSPRSIVFAFTNNTGSTVTSLDVSFNYEKYRSGTRAFDWTFFHGSSSAPSTADANGNQSYSADANNTTISNPPASVSKSFTISGLSITNGTTYYLRWTYTGSGGSTNAQGLGIDDFSLTLNGTSCAAPSTQASALGTNTPNVDGFSVSWTAGDGSGTMLVIRPTAQTNQTPASGTNYTADLDWTVAGQINTDNRVVYRALEIAAGPITGLSAETQYTITAYEYNNTGDCYNLTSPPSANVFTLSTEPTAHAGSFSNTVVAFDQISLSYTSPSGGADGYVILRRADGVVPTTSGVVDGVAPGSWTLPSGTVVANSNATGTSWNNTGLTGSTSYCYLLIPFNWNGTNAQTYNYLTTATVPSTCGTTPLTPSNESNVVDNTNYATGTPEFNSNINYINFIDGTSTTTGKMIPMKFKIQDGGDDLIDADNFNTTLTGIRFTVQNHLGVNQLPQIKTAILTTSGGSVIATASKVGSELVFSGMSGTNVTAVDIDNSGSGDRILHLRVSFDETQVIDNTKLVFAVSGVTAASGSSLFLASNGGGATTDASNTNDRNRIEVTADRLAFGQQPTNTPINTGMAPAVTVRTVDVNGNIDLDYSGTANITSTGTLTGSPVSATLTAGLATFSGLTHTVAGTNFNLTATSSGLSNAISTSFDIINFTFLTGDVRPLIDFADFSFGGSSPFWWEEFNGTSWINRSASPQSSKPNRLIIDRPGVTGGGNSTNTYNDIIIQSGGELFLLDNDNPPVVAEFLNANKTLEVLAGGKLFIRGDIDLPSSGNLIVRSGGEMIIDQNSVRNDHPMWDGIELFEGGSTVNIKDWDWTGSSTNWSIFNNNTSINFNNNGWKFGNLILDVNNSTQNWQIVGGNLGGIINLCENDLDISNIGTSYIMGASNRTGTNGFIVNGNMTIYDGNFSFGSSHSNDAFNHQFIINGNFECASNDALKIHHTGLNTPTGLSGSVTFKGNVTVGNTVTQFANDASSANTRMFVNFEGGNQAQPLFVDIAPVATAISMNIKGGSFVQLKNNNLRTNSLTSNTATITVESNATLHFGWASNNTTPLVINKTGSGGTNNFITQQASTLIITSLDGIQQASGTTGNVQYTTGNKTFNQTATFHYVGKANQVTGDAITSASNGKVIICDLIDNNTQLRFTNSTGITNATGASGTGGKLDIRKGQVIESTTAFITGSTGTLYMSPGTLYQIAKGSATATAAYADLIPRVVGGSFPYILTGGTIELTGNGSADAFQVLRGSQSRPNYIHVKFSGANTYGTDYKALSTQTEIDSSLIVTGTTVVDCINSTGAAASFVGTGGLVMDGGTLRIKKLNDSNPELAGTALNYNLTAGTIEFYGSGVTQNQRIRATDGSGTISYHNIEINAAATNLNFGGTLGNVTPAASIVVTGTLNVNKPASFRLDATNSISGAGNFAVNDSSTLFYASPNGIRTSGTGTSDGHIRITGTRTFSSNASYGFISNQNMVSGDALPAQVRNLYCAKSNASNTVTLTNSVQIANTLEMNNGNLITGANLLELGLSTTERGNLNYTDGHVIGIMKRWFNGTNSGDASGLFPIGVGGADRFATVEYGTAPSAGGSLTARFVSSAMGLSGLPITGIAGTCATFDASTTADEGYWQIDDADGLSGGNYDITLVGEGISTITDLCQVTALKRVGGGNWIQNGTHTDPTGTIGRPIVKRTGANGWSNWGFGGSPVNPLPVVMGSFTAACESEGILLNWVTLSELNSARFVIEQSTDLIHFDYVDMVSAAGNANEPISYSYTVNRPTPSQTQYFRLKQEDFDGAFEYFGPVAVSCQEQQVITVVVQGSQLNIVGLSANNEALTLKIFDLNGKEIKKDVLTLYSNLVNFNIDLSGYHAGIYFIHLTSSTFSHTQKIVVTH